MTTEMSVQDLVASLQVKALVNTYPKHFNGTLEKARGNSGMVLVSKPASNPRLIALANNHSVPNFLEECDADSNSRDEGTFEPVRKKAKVVPTSDLPESTLIDLLRNIHKAIVLRLDSMEKKMESVTLRCQKLDEKIESMADHLRKGGVKMPESLADSSNKFSFLPGISSNITLVTLNSESEYPDGSWLGDENNPEFRVRCHLAPSDLAHVNSSCQTPEKMALTLLDYLFDRETQACSNISGHGKHGKKQLDPLMIYGIKCHLVHKFRISERDWQRIKLNLDSKCRTAFRRKLKGMPLKVKAFRERGSHNGLLGDGEMDESSSANDCQGDELMSVQLHAAGDDNQTPTFSLSNVNLLRRAGQLTIIKGANSDMDMIDLQDEKEALVDLMENHPVHMELGLDVESIAVGIDQESQIIHTLQGDIQIHATPEQVAEIHRTGKIQILSGNHFLQEVSDVLNLSTHHASDINLTSVPNGLILDDGQDAIAELKMPMLNMDDGKDGM